MIGRQPLPGAAIAGIRPRPARHRAWALSLLLAAAATVAASESRAQAAGPDADNPAEAGAGVAMQEAPVAAAGATHEPGPLPDLAERLAACASCHGRHGEGVIGGAEFYPHLAGKPAGYLLAQMQAFREGRRHYPRMVYLMQYMDDAWLAQIAHWYAGQPVQAVHQRSPRALTLTVARRQRAEQLMFRGDRGRGLPACAACHGDNLAGLEPGVPALTGLPADYLVAQFGGWVTGMRRSQEPDCMADIARRLDPADISLVANWLAAQPAQADLRPAPAGSWSLPVPCGPLAAGPAVPDATAEAAGSADRPMRSRP